MEVENNEIDANARIREVCLERIGRASSTGLSQMVLCAVVRRELAPDVGFVSDKEIEKQLTALKDAGRVRTSAKRWFS